MIDDIIILKFLHAASSSRFEWPTREDKGKVHKSCIFFGPVTIFGNDLTDISIPIHSEVTKVHQFIKRFNL